MKKLSFILAGALALVGFTSCEQDKDPVYHAPTSFELNTPVMQDQYIDLSNEGTIELVAKAQPDYGYSAVTHYSALVSLTEDFADFVEVKSVGTGTHSRMEFNNADVAMAICQLKGITDEDSYVEEPAIPLYFRGVAELTGVESSRIVSSNTVCLKQVKYYFAVPVPGYIYIVGGINGWNEPKESNKALYNDWRLFEADNAIGSKVYSAVFDIPAGDLYFRFYTELTGWGSDDAFPSVGPFGTDGVNLDVEFVDGSFGGSAVPGKGSWHIPNWEGGEMTIIVNLANENDMTVQFISGAAEVFTPRYVYVVGNNAGWAEPSEANAATYEAWRLVDKKESGIYTGTFDFTDFTTADGVLYCRFFETLSGWDDSLQWASDASGDVNVDIDFGTQMPVVYDGRGCFTGEVAGTTVTITLDTNNNTVTFEQE